MTQFSDSLFLGGAPTFVSTENNGGVGVGPMGRSWSLAITPVALNGSNIAGTQAMTASMTLNGALVNSTGTAILDVERSVRITGIGTIDISGTNCTVSGFDRYGQFLTNTIAGPNSTNVVETNKTFKAVTSITWPGTSAMVISAGSGDRFGFPYRVTNTAHVYSARMTTGGTGSSVLAMDQGTVQAAATATATATTFDVRGWYKPSVASDGTRVLTVLAYSPDDQAGPVGVATQAGAVGVTQA